MKSNSYLYGETEPKPIPKEVIDNRVYLMKVQLDREQDRKPEVRDFIRVTTLVNGIKFWESINDN